MAAQSTSQLLNGQLAALDAPLSDDSLHALALLVGPAMLLEALDLIDKDQGAAPPSLLAAPTNAETCRCPPPPPPARSCSKSRPHHAAQRSTALPSRKLFGRSTLHRLPTRPVRHWLLPLPCVLVRRPRKGEPGHRMASLMRSKRFCQRAGLIAIRKIQCKHLLACRIADRINAWEHKRVGLEWLAGLATKFGAAVPPLLAENPPAEPA